MKLLKVADRCISILGLLLFGILTGISLFYTVYFTTQYEEIPYVRRDIFLLVLAVCAVLVFLMYVLSERILKKEEGREKRLQIFLGFVLIYTLCFGVLWVLGAGCIPVGDQASVCTAASQFQNGDFSMLTEDSYEKYLYIHPHQLGLTALMEIVFAVFGNGNFRAFEFLNCLGAVICVYCGYRITGLMAKDIRARIFYLFLSVFCFPLLFYVTFVYGEIPSLTLCLVAVWMFLEYVRGGKWGWFAGCCAACCLACLIRNNSMILFLAFLCVLAVTGIGRRQWRPFLMAGILIAVLAASRWGLRTLYEQRSGIELNEGAPMSLYVAMGMQEGDRAPGWSNGYILHAYWGECIFDEELAEAMARRDIAIALSDFQEDPAYAARFFWEKFTSQWNNPTYQCFVMTHVNGWERMGLVNSMYDGKLHALMVWFMNQYQSLVFIGVFLWLVFYFWRERGLEMRILLIIIIGGFLFHMIWEAKGRYIFPYFVMMLPMAAIGLSEFAERMIRWIGARQKGVKNQGSESM